jgi:hypothetical protein
MPETTADGRPLIKCSACKAFRLTEEFEHDKFGHRRKTCLICKRRREEKNCIHQRRGSRCKQCGGSQICEHKRERSKCKQCGGASICEHKRERNKCFKCDPSSALWARASNRINAALGTELRAGRTTEQLLGCDKKIFFKHISSLFKEGMSWNEIELIDIDHILPIKYKGVDGMQPSINEMIQRLHYRNCQPLYRTENKVKSNKLNLDELLDEVLNEMPNEQIDAYDTPDKF